MEAFKKRRVTEVTVGRDITVETRAPDEVAESRVSPDPASVGDGKEDSNQVWEEGPGRTCGEDIDWAWQAAGSDKEVSFSVALPTDTTVKQIKVDIRADHKISLDVDVDESRWRAPGRECVRRLGNEERAQ